MPNGKSTKKYAFNTRICQFTVKSILRKVGRIYIILSKNGMIVIKKLLLLIIIVISYLIHSPHCIFSAFDNAYKRP